MTKIVVKHFVKEDKVDEFLQYAKKMVIASVEEEGCIKYELLQDEKDSKIITIIEEWEDKNALDIHMKSSHFLELIPQMNNLLEKENEINSYKKII